MKINAAWVVVRIGRANTMKENSQNKKLRKKLRKILKRLHKEIAPDWSMNHFSLTFVYHDLGWCWEAKGILKKGYGRSPEEAAHNLRQQFSLK
jgi:hypothetical protein